MRRTVLPLVTGLLAATALAGCGQVNDTFGVKSAASPTSDRATYLSDISSSCATAKKQFDADAARFAASNGQQAQADGIDRILQDYSDLEREVSRIPAPTAATSGLAVQVLDGRLPDRGALAQKRDDLRKNLTTLSAQNVSDIASGLKSDFCDSYASAVGSRLG